MIKPGTNLCRVCGKTSHIHFYRSGEEGQGAQLVWDSETNAFVLKHYVRDRTTTSTATKHFSLVDPEKYHLGDPPPNRVSAIIDTNLTPVTLYRSCPHCWNHEIFPPDMGKIPCFVVAVIGAVSAGKTAWLGALTNALDALSEQKYPYKIEPWKLQGDTEAARSTNGYENGNTNYFSIINRRTNKHEAILYLLDYAGELYTGQNISPDTPLGRILLGEAGEGYPGLDGAVFIEPAVRDPLNRNQAGADDVIQVIGELREILRKIPIARVCTFADKLIEFESKYSTRTIPLLSEKTFPRTVYSNESNKQLISYYTPDAIIRRIHLQDYIADQIVNDCAVGRRLNHFFGRDGFVKNEKFYSFLVQSCNHISDNSNDYKTQFNVADPLIWLLFKLKLFPLTLTGG